MHEDDHPDGYGFLMTTRGVRNRPYDPSCERATTTVVLDGARYGSAVFCSSQPRHGSSDWRAHDGRVVLQSEEGEQHTRPGYGLALSSYDAPDWSEVTLGSVRLRCWGPLH
jgi:hypothetical protein